MINEQRAFQHTAARRRLGTRIKKSKYQMLFQHTAARRRLENILRFINHYHRFNTQPPEGGWHRQGYSASSPSRFNTQPPEGGWAPSSPLSPRSPLFQHTAARRRLGLVQCPLMRLHQVSTHSRPKAAGNRHGADGRRRAVSTHSRPKAAGPLPCSSPSKPYVSTHSRPKAAGAQSELFVDIEEFQHTAARRRLVKHLWGSECVILFQHTATRRRLACQFPL